MSDGASRRDHFLSRQRAVFGRWWIERDAAIRALLPAWPVVLVVFIAIFALCVTDQGREAARVSLDLSGARGDPFGAFVSAVWGLLTLERAEDPTFPRYVWFLIAMLVFCLTIMASTVFVLSVDRQPPASRYDDDDDPETPQRALSPITPDIIHPSDLLRTRAALVLGLATPVALALVALGWQDEGADRAGMLNVGLRLAIALAAGLAVLGVLHIAGRYVPRGLAGLRTKWLDKVRDLPRRERKPDAATRARFYLLEAARVVSDGPARFAISVLLGVAAFLIASKPTSVGGVWDAYVRAFGLLGLLVVIAFITAAFHITRRRALHVVQRDYMGRVIVFNRVFARCYRGATALLFLLAIVVFWSGLRLEIGPVAIFLQGLAALMGLLVWLVSRAMAPPPERPMLRVRVWPPLRPLYALGAGMEVVQRHVSPRLIFSTGLTLMLFDWIVLGSLENADGLSDTVRGLLLAAGALALFGVIWVSPLFIRKWFDIPEGSIRLASLVIILPFMLLTSGENHQLATLPADPAHKLPTASAHAAAWLAAARDRANAAECKALDPAAPCTPASDIPAIVILAEGGGIRAASHIGHLLGRLEEQEAAECGDRNPADCPHFYDNVYAMSGVSGGAVGLATYLVAKAEARRPEAASAPPACIDGTPASIASNLRCRIDLTLSRDHLSALFAGMFGSDIPSLFVPAELPKRIRRLFRPDYEPMQDDHPTGAAARGWADRADFFEHSLQHAWARSRPEGAPADASAFDASLEQVARASAFGPELTPMVLFGTFSADDGRMAAAANVRFDECISTGAAERLASLKSVQSCFVDLEKIKSGDPQPPLARTLPLSAAAHLSARFPVSNPPGVVDAPVFASATAPGEPLDVVGWRHLRFVDGGYFDNSGGAAASFALQALYDAADALDPLPADPASADPAPSTIAPPAAPGLTPLAAPLTQQEALERASEPGPPKPPRLRDRLRVIVIHVYTRNVLTEKPSASSKAMFTEVNTPKDAILIARDTSGFFPASSFCRLAALDQAGAADICDSLVRHRTAYEPTSRDFAAASLSAVTEPRNPAVVTAVLDQQETITTRAAPRADARYPGRADARYPGRADARYNVAWINAPLDVAFKPGGIPGAYDGQPAYEYVLLGWMLQQSSHAYIDESMCRLAPHILYALRKASAAPEARLGQRLGEAHCDPPPPAGQ